MSLASLLANSVLIRPAAYHANKVSGTLSTQSVLYSVLQGITETRSLKAVNNANLLVWPAWTLPLTVCLVCLPSTFKITPVSLLAQTDIFQYCPVTPVSHVDFPVWLVFRAQYVSLAPMTTCSTVAVFRTVLWVTTRTLEPKSAVLAQPAANLVRFKASAQAARSAHVSYLAAVSRCVPPTNTTRCTQTNRHLTNNAYANNAPIPVKSVCLQVDVPPVYKGICFQPHTNASTLAQWVTLQTVLLLNAQLALQNIRTVVWSAISLAALDASLTICCTMVSVWVRAHLNTTAVPKPVKNVCRLVWTAVHLQSAFHAWLHICSAVAHA